MLPRQRLGPLTADTLLCIVVPLQVQMAPHLTTLMLRLRGATAAQRDRVCCLLDSATRAVRWPTHTTGLGNHGPFLETHSSGQLHGRCCPLLLVALLSLLRCTWCPNTNRMCVRVVRACVCACGHLCHNCRHQDVRCMELERGCGHDSVRHVRCNAGWLFVENSVAHAL